MIVRVRVVTVSDRAFTGEYEDLSGPEIVALLKAHFGDGVETDLTVVPDEADQLTAAFDEAASGENPVDAVLTCGGTGIGPRDITPDVTMAWCEKELPGIAEMLRRESCAETPQAALSRGYAGVKGRTLVVNFPGSVKAARLCTRLMLPLLDHAPQMLSGGGH